MVWAHTISSNKQKKAWQDFSVKKLMATVFWNAEEVLLVEFIEQR